MTMSAVQPGLAPVHGCSPQESAEPGPSVPFADAEVLGHELGDGDGVGPDFHRSDGAGHRLVHDGGEDRAHACVAHLAMQEGEAVCGQFGGEVFEAGARVAGPLVEGADGPVGGRAGMRGEVLELDACAASVGYLWSGEADDLRLCGAAPCGEVMGQLPGDDRAVGLCRVHVDLDGCGAALQQGGDERLARPVDDVRDQDSLGLAAEPADVFVVVQEAAGGRCGQGVCEEVHGED
ncbi:hypothetical protein [Streptomyces sp. NPDC058295]|uniref:hypothetical protein n=1 Tax=Streptomyces sp. NPDC058295 TaxID=3346431 RepID=UPI0036F027CA